MTREQIAKIVDFKAFKDSSEVVELIETHISWVVLTEHFAFKIKKPVKFSFLDFSTLKKRKYYCEQEVVLNQRLAKEMYLGSVPIRFYQGIPFIEGANGKVIDYAVKMKRVDNDREMDKLLKAGKVNKAHLFQLADQLSTFHAFTDEAVNTPSIRKMQKDFADIAKVKEFILTEISSSASKLIEEGVHFSKKFLTTHQNAIIERHQNGMTVDGHGDLHTGNIFLLNQPMIFDCIEFDSGLRQTDVLSELAFLCMDLDFYGKEGLATYLMERYNINYPVINDSTDRLLFLYYKLYRANIRIKVNALQAMQAEDPKVKEKYIGLVEDYYHLFRRYLKLLKEREMVLMLKEEQAN